tara:strand:- start:205618 stop:207492 length:1875 start_codon:yes stop_codon:yes gene_type:complete
MDFMRDFVLDLFYPVFTLQLFIFSVGFLALWAFKIIKSQPRDGLYALLFLVGGFLLAFSYHLNKDLWFDETLQINSLVRWSYFDSLINYGVAAAWIQQPPLDMMINAFVFKHLGWSPLSARLHSILFFALANGALYLLLRQLFPRILSLVLSALFVTDLWVINLGAEARTYGLAIFASVVFLIGLFNYMDQPKTKKSAFSLVLITLFFCHSISLQPAIIVSCTLAVTLILLFTTKNKKLFLPVGSKLFFALLGTLPFYITLLIFNRDKNEYVSQKILDWSQIKWQFYYGFLKEFQGPFPWWGPLFWMLPLVAIPLVYLTVVKKTNCTSKTYTSLVALSVSAFPIIYFLFFTILVKWHLSYRYLIVSIPFYIIANGFIYQELSKRLENLKVRGRSLKLARFAPLVFILAYGCYVVPIKFPKYNISHLSERLYFMGYNGLDDNVRYQLSVRRPGDVFLIIHRQPPNEVHVGGWASRNWISGERADFDPKKNHWLIRASRPLWADDPPQVKRLFITLYDRNDSEKNPLKTPLPNRVFKRARSSTHLIYSAARGDKLNKVVLDLNDYAKTLNDPQMSQLKEVLYILFLRLQMQDKAQEVFEELIQGPSQEYNEALAQFRDEIMKIINR